MRAGRSYVFVGPTLARGEAAGLPFPFEDDVVLPPVRRGDVQRIVASVARPGTLVIVDGCFHLEHLAVGHHELRRALDLGWRVWGLSSMGAIRACEMRDLGMRGFGAVYRRFVADPRFRDDEVALLHEPTPPYRTFSEPLVHIRAGLETAAAEGMLAASVAESLVATLAPRWFGDRTLPALGELLSPALGPEVTRAFLLRFDEFQEKSRDLSEFLAARGDLAQS